MLVHETWLFVYILLFHSLLFGLRSYLLWKQTGVRAITFQNRDDAHDWNGRLFTFLSLAAVAIAAVYAFSASWYVLLVPIPYLEGPALHLVGWALLLLSLPVIFLAQMQMAGSWRVGIDEKERTPLVTHGLFSCSRNPIFLGLLVSLLGFFFVVPNAYSLLLLGLSYASIQIQVRLEEPFLRAQHGAAYERYCEQVRRWV
ncbi:MAG: isoprenylcysteine carboxylmethyltransferase family protein [Lewinellaceae bacterium]|nr:isoprenylcysteine carboxylmethyltransferase family protein [Lewinellaceae bacterium]